MKILLLLLAIIAPNLCTAALYKCELDGKTTYQNQVCPEQQQATEVDLPPAVVITPPAPSLPAPKAAPIVIERDAHGHIKRSEAAKNQFKAQHPCPANGKRFGSCRGYVIDHIKALACGGADDPSNMQWQSLAEGKAKDKWERDGCQVSTSKTVVAEKSSKSASQQRRYNSHRGSSRIYVGPRGGRYVITASGQKRYLPKN